jgi:predicted RNA methylase
MGSQIDADKYYTPPSVAIQAFERARLTDSPYVCADTACGSGSLLTAAESVLKAKHCLGIDSDSQAIRQLRRARPDWHLYVGDLLQRHRAPVIDFQDSNRGVDLLVLNPPFSLGSKKYVSVKYLGRTVKCSVAMAHILRSLEIFKPKQGAIAVVPESLLHSDTDRHARDFLDQRFSLTEMLQLSIYTFKGARVNSSFVQFGVSRDRRNFVKQSSSDYFDAIPAKVVRGGLQMHVFERLQHGVPVIHSTSLRDITVDGFSSVEERTSMIAKGRISGWMLLLPRVGTPKLENVHPLYSREEVQLSDCVIGIKFPSRVAAFAANKRISENWGSLFDLYRGTGARYITVDRLIEWLFGVGIHDESAMREFWSLPLG